MIAMSPEARPSANVLILATLQNHVDSQTLGRGFPRDLDN